MGSRGWLLIALLAAMPVWVSPAYGAAKPVVTNKSRFRIPFRFDAAALQRMNARELQLFVSANRGASWELSQAIGPQSGKFEFQAPSDGEYWFAVRTIDAAGGAHPPGPRLEAGLVVIVDSLAPSLAVNLEQIEPGKIALTWSASDPNLDATTLRLEYLQPGQDGWQAVSIVPTQRGTTQWTVPAAGRVSVRGSVADLAGNLGQAEAHVEAAAARKGSSPNVPDLRHPIASEPQVEQFSEAPQLPIVPGASPAVKPRSATSDDLAASPQPTTSPGMVIRNEPFQTRTTTPLVSNSNDRLPSVVQDRWPAVEATPVETPLPPSRTSGRQRVVNTRKFQLGYKVDDVGPSGVGSVDLYITPDRGRQWYRYGEDPDRVSPFDVEVPRDGEYGFTVRVRSGAGLAIDPPVPGEAPSIEVIVDQTAPRIELQPIQQGRGADLNKLTIAWRIQEDRPTEKPVSLYYGPSRQGPWEPISGWIADTGSYAWTVGLGAPPQFHIRLVARDAAGNVAEVISAQPVVVDLSRPSARIVDVEISTESSPRQ